MYLFTKPIGIGGIRMKSKIHKFYIYYNNLAYHDIDIFFSK